MTAYSLFVCIGCGFETRDMQEFIKHKDSCSIQMQRGRCKDECKKVSEVMNNA
jgi:hypothetical protein